MNYPEAWTASDAATFKWYVVSNGVFAPCFDPSGLPYTPTPLTTPVFAPPSPVKMSSTRDQQPYRLRRISDDSTRDAAMMTPEQAERANERLKGCNARVWGEQELEWILAEVKGPPSWTTGDVTIS